MLFYILVMAPFMALGFWAQHKVTSNFRRWSEVRASSGRTGAEVARTILDRNGLHDVQVLTTPGELSDHYDPRSRTVNLSEPVYGSNSVAAVAVAAHEVGHALQHQQSYAPLAIRSAVLPAAALGSSAFMPLFLVGMVLTFLGLFLGQWVILAAIVLFAFAVVFQLVTLPVEFNASSRAKRQLQELQLAPVGGGSPEAEGTSAVLGAAAMTYVAAALMSVAQLAYFAMSFLGGE